MQVIRDICSVMRAIPYYEEGTIKVVQDAPKDHANPSALRLYFQQCKCNWWRFFIFWYIFKN